MTVSTGWEALNAALAEARAEIAAAAPDAAAAEEGEAYLARVLTTSLADNFMGHVLTEGGLTRPLPSRGGVNPDYLMSHAPIDPACAYRLEGRLEDSERVGVGLYRAAMGGALLIAAYTAFDTANVAADGRFSLDLAAGAEGPGALAIPADARVLIVRVLHRDPAARPARLALSVGARAPALAAATGSAEGALAQAGRVVLASVRQFLQWSGETSAQPNRFIPPPESLGGTVQGDADTVYYLGYYQLQDGEWLEAALPANPAGYWSLHAYNHWLEELPGAGVHDRSAVREADGRVRAAIGPAPPADHPNRIDTLGRRRGVLICRFIGAPNPRAPDARVVRAGGA